MLTRLTRNRAALVGMLSSVVLTLLLAVALIPGQSARAAANAPTAAPTLDIFAKILDSAGTPINGDSTAKGFEKQIPVQSFSFAGMNSAPTGTGAGKAIASPITFTAPQVRTRRCCSRRW